MNTNSDIRITTYQKPNGEMSYQLVEGNEVVQRDDSYTVLARARKKLRDDALRALTNKEGE